MNRLSPKIIMLAWLALAAVAFFVGTSFEKREPAGGETARAVSPAVDAPTRAPVVDAPAAVPPKMKLDRKSTTPLGPAGTARLAVGSEMVVERVGDSIDAMERTKAAKLAQTARYREELQTLFKSLTVNNAREIAAAIKTNDDGGSAYGKEVEPVIDEFYRAWGALAGADAMAFQNETKGAKKKAVIEGWAKSDPEAAKAYAATLDAETPYKAEINNGIVASLAGTNLDDALAYSLENERNLAAASTSASALTQLVFEKRGVAGLESWLKLVNETLGPDESVEYRNLAVQVGLGYMEKADPARARELLLDYVGRGSLGADAVDDSTDRIRFTTGEADRLSIIAMAKAPTEQEQGDFAELLTEKFDYVLQTDLGMAGKWLSSQSLSARHDGSIEKFALAIVGADREAALQWVQQISDASLREAVLAKPEFSENRPVPRPQKQ